MNKLIPINELSELHIDLYNCLQIAIEILEKDQLRRVEKICREIHWKQLNNKIT
jgi:hypothetical protein